MGYHAYGTFSFAATVIAYSEKDNSADTAARIILWTWWIASIVIFLFIVINHLLDQWRNSQAGYRRITSSLAAVLESVTENLWGLFAWYGVNFVVIWFMALLKGQAGYTDPNPPVTPPANNTDSIGGADGKWHWYVYIGPFGFGG